MGWILCESVINNEMNIGLRLTDFNASAPPSIKALLATVAPKKDDIMPNTGVALLSKVLEKLNLAGDPQAVAGSKDAGKGKREKKDEEGPKEENEEGKKECATKEEGPKDPKQTKAEKDAKRGAAGAVSSAQTKAEKRIFHLYRCARANIMRIVSGRQTGAYVLPISSGRCSKPRAHNRALARSGFCL